MITVKCIEGCGPEKIPEGVFPYVHCNNVEYIYFETEQEFQKYDQEVLLPIRLKKMEAEKVRSQAQEIQDFISLLERCTPDQLAKINKLLNP